MSQWVIEKLDKRKHHRDHFDCGIEVLDVYLKKRASQEQKKRLNVTYVAVLNSEKAKKPILGYYTVSNSAIAIASLQTSLTRHVPSTYDIPSVKIGRLAVDANYQNQGLGRDLLKDAFKRTIEIASLSGIKGVEIVAKNQLAIEFYKKYGFVSLQDTKNLLFLPIETIIDAMPG